MTDRIYAVTMPRWGIGMEQGTIAEWLAVPGEHVNKGDALIGVETDKIVNSVEAPAAGVLHRIVATTGQVLPVGALLAVVGGSDVGDAEIDGFIARFRPASYETPDPEA
jgi:pyruvate dehydrogenase E2 component (dihydrolipoamide acetyltransferase)